MNLTILLFNNQIYGLTKGQYSPTSEVGKVTKSTPFGSLDYPFSPVSLALGAEAGFVARTHDMDRKHMMETFRRGTTTRALPSSRSTRTAMCSTTGRSKRSCRCENRSAMLISLVHGEPIRFGADNEKGVVMGTDGQLRIVDVAEVGESALLVHDEHHSDPGLCVRAVAAEP